MITIGGLDNVNATDYCDWEYMSVGIYDLTEGESVGWGSVFSADKPPYQVNARIFAVIGGGPNGNATKLLPDGGWSSTLVASLFTGTDNQTAPVPISGSSTKPPLPSTVSATSNHTNIAVISGGIVGGIAAVVLFTSLALFVRHHLKAARKDKDDGQQQHLKPEMEGLGKPKSDSHPPGAETKPTELPSIYQTISEASGNPRSELSGRQIPVEVAGSDVPEMI
jgi:hypothetical protein